MLRFREILAEVDEDFTETELDDIIAEVRKFHLIYQNQNMIGPYAWKNQLQ